MQQGLEPPSKDTHTMALAQDKAKLAVAAVKGDDTQARAIKRIVIHLLFSRINSR